MVRGIRRPRSSTQKNKRTKLTRKSSSLESSNASSHQSLMARKGRSTSSRRSTIGSSTRPSGATSSSSNNSYNYGIMQLPNRKLLTVSLKLLAEIKRLQTMSGNHIPKMPFSRLVREILLAMKDNPDVLRMQPAALQGLQFAAEYYITTLFGDSNQCAMHAKRITVMPPDIKLVLDLRSAYDPNMVI